MGPNPSWPQRNDQPGAAPRATVTVKAPFIASLTLQQEKTLHSKQQSWPTRSVPPTLQPLPGWGQECRFVHVLQMRQGGPSWVFAQRSGVSGLFWLSWNLPGTGGRGGGGSGQSWALRSRAARQVWETGSEQSPPTAAGTDSGSEGSTCAWQVLGPRPQRPSHPARLSPDKGRVLLTVPITSAAEQGPRRRETLQSTLAHPALPEATPGPGARASVPPKITRAAANSRTSPTALFISPQIPESKWQGRTWPNTPRGPNSPCAKYEVTKKSSNVERYKRAMYFLNCGSGCWILAALSSFCR